MVLFAFDGRIVGAAAAFALILSLAMIVHRRWLFAIACSVVIALFPPGYNWMAHGIGTVHYKGRDFFGIVSVIDTPNNMRLFMHGITAHGTQSLDPRYRLEPLSYFYRGESGMADVFQYLDTQPGAQRVAVMGLGVGVMACFQKPGRHYDFYEISEKVIEVAENPAFFTFLSDCGSSYSIIRGDGRQEILKKPDGFYDAIMMDAFSSDNVPAHLLTTEAAALYLQKAKPGAPIIYNIANRYLDLEPIVAANADALGVTGLVKMGRAGVIEGTDISYYPSAFFALAQDEGFERALRTQGWSDARMRDDVRAWSDQFSNIISVIGPRTSVQRFQEMLDEVIAQDDR